MFASFFDKSAVQKIESLGGLSVAVYLDINGWRSLANPSKFGKLAAKYERLPPRTWKERLFYSSYENRGYLNENLQQLMPEETHDYISRHFSLIPEVKCESEEALIAKAKKILKIL